MELSTVDHNNNLLLETVNFHFGLGNHGIMYL